MVWFYPPGRGGCGGTAPLGCFTWTYEWWLRLWSILGGGGGDHGWYPELSHHQDHQHPPRPPPAETDGRTGGAEVRLPESTNRWEHPLTLNVMTCGPRPPDAVLQFSLRGKRKRRRRRRRRLHCACKPLHVPCAGHVAQSYHYFMLMSCAMPLSR